MSAKIVPTLRSLLAAAIVLAVPAGALAGVPGGQGSRNLALQMSVNTGVSWFEDAGHEKAVKRWLDAFVAHDCAELAKRTSFPFFLEDHETEDAEDLVGGTCGNNGTAVAMPDGVAYAMFGEVRATEAASGDRFLNFGYADDSDLYFIVMTRGRAMAVLASEGQDGRLRFKGYWN